MSRKISSAARSIRSICNIYKLDEELLKERAKWLLETYRDVCWIVNPRDSWEQEIEESFYQQMKNALISLHEFGVSDSLEERKELLPLFETKWMMELIETAMLKMKEFPFHQDVYYNIVSKCYISRYHYNETELMECLGLERSQYYDRKKEAVLVFGIAFWGYTIPVYFSELKKIKACI